MSCKCLDYESVIASTKPCRIYYLHARVLQVVTCTKWLSYLVQVITCQRRLMGSNANAFKCILNTFEKYLDLHLNFSNEKYLHLKIFSNTFEIILNFLKKFYLMTRIGLKFGKYYFLSLF